MLHAHLFVWALAIKARTQTAGFNLTSTFTAIIRRGLRRNAMINDPGLRQGLLSSAEDGEAGEIDPVKDAFSGNGKLLDEAKALSEAQDQVSNCGSKHRLVVKRCVRVCDMNQ